jgi:hypothetical protein
LKLELVPLAAKASKVAWLIPAGTVQEYCPALE